MWYNESRNTEPMKKNTSIPKWQNHGFTLTETLITGALFGLAIVVSTLLLSTERARTRDAIRLADMTRVASGFALLFSQQASYAPAAAGCGQIGSAVSSCSITTPLGSVADLRDPSRGAYTIARVPDRDDFGVSFQLERRYGNFAAGQHVLTKAGIQ